MHFEFESMKNIEFDFGFAPNGQKYLTYKFKEYQIFDEQDNFICSCDITAYNMEYKKENLLICCLICLRAYYQGIKQGKIEKQKEIRKFLLED